MASSTFVGSSDPKLSWSIGRTHTKCHNSFMDLHNSFMDLHNSFLIMYPHNSFMDLHNPFMDLHNLIYGDPKIELWRSQNRFMDLHNSIVLMPTSPDFAVEQDKNRAEGFIAPRPRGNIRLCMDLKYGAEVWIQCSKRKFG